jgi:hypothetical protein
VVFVTIPQFPDPQRALALVAGPMHCAAPRDGTVTVYRPGVKPRPLFPLFTAPAPDVSMQDKRPDLVHTAAVLDGSQP